MPEYEVTLSRTIIQRAVVRVTAANSEDAIEVVHLHNNPAFETVHENAYSIDKVIEKRKTNA